MASCEPEFGELRAEFGDLKAELHARETRLIKWLAGLMVAGVAAAAAGVAIAVNQIIGLWGRGLMGSRRDATSSSKEKGAGTRSSSKKLLRERSGTPGAGCPEDPHPNPLPEGEGERVGSS